MEAHGHAARHQGRVSAQDWVEGVKVSYKVSRASPLEERLEDFVATCLALLDTLELLHRRLETSAEQRKLLSL